MSKTFEALRKAEAARHPGPPPASDPETSPATNGKRTSSARLEYEHIRVWLKNPVAQGQRLRTVMVIACHSGNGGTTTAALLATTLAQGKSSRVLIMDTNFRTPGMNFFFKIKTNGHAPSPEEELPFDAKLHRTDRENLYVLTSDTPALSALDAFEGEALDELIEEMKKRFDFIVFDAPPALDFPDAYALAPKVDGIILVTEAERTLIEDAQRAKRDLERAGGRVLGVVMNRQMNYLPGFLRRFVAS